MSTKRISGELCRDLFVLEDENNPDGSKMNTVWASTTLDQVFDNLSPIRKTLREILEDLRIEIITGGKGNIVFPVTSVNGKTDDVIITSRDIGLENVDNTRDMDKPLSGPQRTSVMNILKYYDFNIDLHDLYNHIGSFDNPHNITVSQLDKDGKLSNLIQKYVKQHNQAIDDSIHMDIRTLINRVSDKVNELDQTIDTEINRVLKTLGNHLEDIGAHQELLDEKEDVSNKVVSFTSTLNKDHTKYPSTRAVVEFVESRISDFKDTLPDLKGWIDDIEVIDSRDDLPPLSSKSHRKTYFIRHGNSSHDEIAVCRLNPDGESYSWDISPMGTYSKFDPKYFMDTIDGLSINIRSMMDAVIGENGMLDTSLADTLKNYYTKDEIDKKHFVDSITILPGTMDGHIRYYINDDLETMSDDVRIPGLQRLAYLEWITENELWDQSVHERHILSKAVATRHIQTRAVTADKLFTSPEANMVLAVLDTNSDPIYTKITSRMIGESEIDATKIRSSDKDNRVLGVIHAGRPPEYVTINHDMLEDNIIDTQQLFNESVTTAKLGEKSVSTSKLEESSVTTDKINDNAVTNRKILDRSVSHNKITCEWDHIIGNIENESNDHAHEISLKDLAISLKRFRVPSNLPTHLWKVNTEYSLNDGSYGCRFTGMITMSRGKRAISLLTSQINLSLYRFVDAGGTWVYKSNPDGWITLSCSGDFSSFIRMEFDGLYLDTLSSNDRIDAKYDVWIKYIKNSEIIQPIDPDGDFFEEPILQCDKDCGEVIAENILDMWNGTYEKEDETNDPDSLCQYLTTDDIRSMYDGTYEDPVDDGVGCNNCDEFTSNDIRIMYGLEPIESDGSNDNPIVTHTDCNGNCEQCGISHD